MLLLAASSAAAQDTTSRALRLDTVAVVASRTRPDAAGRTVDVVTRDDITRSPARTLAELLATRLSVDAYTR